MSMFEDSLKWVQKIIIIGPNAKYQIIDAFTVKDKYNYATFFKQETDWKLCFVL